MNTTSKKNPLTGALSGGYGEAGISMVETLIALFVAVVAIAGGFLVNSHELAIVKSTRESGQAAGALEERVEQLRAATWKQVTDPAYLTETFFATQSRSVAALPNHWEQIEVTGWPKEGAATPLLVEKYPRAGAAVLKPGQGLANERMAKVDVRVFWIGQGGRTRMRDATTLISNGGVNRMNLPGLGTGGESTPEPGVDPPSDPTPPPDAPPGNGQGNGGVGNGQGRGNVAGKPGKN